MKANNYFFTSESVSEGHPDKVADQISDAILDAYLTLDKDAHVACETLVTSNLVVLAGEVKAKAHPNVEQVVRNVIGQIGYNRIGEGFCDKEVAILNQLHMQSSDIDMGVKQGTALQGAGDQGMMFGYATNETPTYMPMSIYLAHMIVKELANNRHKNGNIIRPDSKSQVTIEYKDGEPVHVDTVVVSTQHEDYGESDVIMHKDIVTFVIKEIMPNVLAQLPKNIKSLFDEKTKYYINPTGRFVLGGPNADTGLTGRKIIVDTYGGRGAHGGGAFSGKDPSKVDRSAAYMARFIAKNLVANGVADEMLVQLSYAIGKAEPVSVFVDTYGTSHKSTDEQIAAFIQSFFPLTPHGIETYLNLRGIKYLPTASYGHFGREYDPELNSFTWENVMKMVVSI